MSKTWVQILNEYCSKKKIAMPAETTILDETGKHNPKFVIELQADGQRSTGEGNTKKQARQQAAKNLLDLLGVSEVKEKPKEPEISSLQETEEGEKGNAIIAQLSVYCTKKKHPPPRYQDLEERGKDHDKTFVVQCSVSGLHEVGEAKQRKRARQLSASKMYKRLKAQDSEDVASGKTISEDVGSGKTISEDVGSCKTTSETAVSSTEAANETTTNSEVNEASATHGEETGNEASSVLHFDKNKVFEQLVKLKTACDPELSTMFKDHCETFIGTHEKSETLKKLVDKEIENDKDNAVELLTSVAEELGKELELKKYENYESGKKKCGEPYLYLYILKTDTIINGAGYDENSAAHNLLDTLVVQST